jgi:hypothetical protein
VTGLLVHGASLFPELDDLARHLVRMPPLRHGRWWSVGLGIPKEEAEHYDREFRAGRTIITVQADGRAEEVRAILREYGGYERPGAPPTV